MAILDSIKNQFASQQEEGSAGNAAKASVIKKLCPKCHGCTLEFTEDESYVTCYACDQSISVAELLAAPASGGGVAAAGGVAPVVMVDSPESGLIYLENYFANFDWTLYNQSARILIADVDRMVENNKVKQGASPASWLLDFQSVATPVRKKMEGLDALEAEIAEKYSADNTGVMQLFDRYKNITAALLDQKDSLIKRMENDVSFAERQGLDAAQLKEMTAELEALIAAFGNMKEVKEMTDLPAVAKKQAQIDKEMVRSFKEKGIDVVGEYKNACMYYGQNTKDKRAALKSFELIRGYADSISYIRKINYYFNYYNKFFNFFGTNFVFKTHQGEVPEIDPNAKDAKKGCFAKKKKQPTLSEEEAYTGETLELFEVVNGEPAEEPTLKSITQIIKYYGSVLYYVKLDKVICAFDLATKIEKELLRVENPDDLKVFWNVSPHVCGSTNGRSIYIRKRLDLIVDKPGCKGKLLGKKETIVERRNNYEVYELSLDKCTCEKVIDQVVDVIERRQEFLFYTVAEELPRGVEETEETKKELRKLSVMAMNTDTYEKEVIFQEDCDIKAISGTKIVYTLRTPNRFNLDLHVLDIVTKKDVIVEKNIYRFLTVTEDKIFYYVGNRNYQPLFSNNFEGTDRVEIMTNIENIVSVAAGWMYVIKGSSRNALLIKISTDGKQRIVICSQFKKSIKITDSHIYYVTSGNDLRVVRSDGKDNTLIAEDIDLKNIIVDKNCIYYLRHEWTGKRMNKSLYMMDIDGHNVRKLLFNVNSMKNYDENTLYVEREDQIRFRIFFPARRKKDETEIEETFDLTRYYKFDKATGELDNVLTVGMPHPSKYEAKGCFGKKKEMEPVFTEIPMEDDFEEKGERAGAVLSEQIAEQAEVEMDEVPQTPGCSKVGAANKPGCSGGNKGGCLKALLKK